MKKQKADLARLDLIKRACRKQENMKKEEKELRSKLLRAYEQLEEATNFVEELEGKVNYLTSQALTKGGQKGQIL